MATRKKRRTNVNPADSCAARGTAINTSENIPSGSEYRETLMKQLRDEFFLEATPGFMRLWTLVQEIDPERPCSSLEELDIHLCGPFHMLEGRAKRDPQTPWFLHSRHRFDPPEVVTFMHSVKDRCVHYGFFRDAPDALPSTIVCGNSREDRGSEFKVVGTTLLSAILKVAKVPKGDKKATTLLARVQAALVDVEDSSLKRKPRIDDTLHKLGIVVPYDKKSEIGWRPLSVTDTQLRKYLVSLLAAKDTGKEPDFRKLDELITYANIANDEGDPGQPLKLGLDLFSFAIEFDTDAGNLLAPTYRLLERDAFATVIESHTADERRRKHAEFSALQHVR